MPEGHTVHRYARQQHAHFAGQRVRVTSPQGRFEAEAARLHGKTLRAVEAWGKHLFYAFPKGLWLHVHLGMAGKFDLHTHPAPPPRESVRVRIATKGYTLDLRGPNTCRLIGDEDRVAVIDRLGPDPLRPDADPEQAWEKVRKSRRKIALLLMDQAIFAGVGNIYRAEVLFVERINPHLPGCDLPRDAFDRIWARLVTWLRLGVESGRIITVGEVDPALAKTGRRFFVYKETACPYTGAAITSWKEGGRMVYALAVESALGPARVKPMPVVGLETD